MEKSEQIRLGRQMLDMLERRETAMVPDVFRNPVQDYTCGKTAARERDLLFRRQALNLGLSCRLPNPGDYLTDDYSGVPILLVRGEDGKLNAFINSCRHRGAEVASGCGQGAKNFRCPYHAWTFALDGRLLRRPREVAFEGGADKDSHGLVPLPVEERHGMIWVIPSPEARMDLDAQLGGLQRDLAAYNLAGYHHYDTRSRRIGMNWKLVVDTFLETYHLNVLHVKTVNPILHSDLGTYDGFGRNVRMAVARRTIEQLRQQPEESWDLIPHTALLYILFPNTVFIMQGDHVETWHVYPDGEDVDSSRMHISLYTPEPTTSESARGHWERNFDLLLATVEKEDFPIGERVQFGFHSGGQEEIVFGRNEPCLQHYHRALHEAMGDAA